MITTAHVLRNRRALFIRDVDSPPVTQLTPGAPSRTAPSSVGHPRPGRLRRPLRPQRQCARTRPPAAPYEGEAHCEQRNYALPYRCVYGTARVGARPVPSGARQNPPPGPPKRRGACQQLAARPDWPRLAVLARSRHGPVAAGLGPHCPFPRDAGPGASARRSADILAGSPSPQDSGSPRPLGSQPLPRRPSAFPQPTGRSLPREPLAAP